MKNISLNIIIDTIFKFVLFFLFNLIWCYYFFKNSTKSIVFSIFFSLLLIFLINFISKRKNIKRLASLKTLEHIQATSTSFLIMDQMEIVDFFYNLIAKNYSCQKYSDHILVETKQFPIVVYPLFKSQELNEDDILKIYKLFKNRGLKRLVVLCSSSKTNITSITKNFRFEVLVLNKEQTYYSLLQKYEFYPEVPKKSKSNPSQTFSILINTAINKKRTKSYFLSALFIIFSSFFVPYKLYYLIVASLLIFLAFYSKFSHRYNLPKNTNPLE